MPVPLRLEQFEPAAEADSPALLMPEQIEDLRLTAYERGYLAGWEDAQRQTASEQTARAAQVAARIEALTFGYHEARAHVLAAIEPLVQAMVGQILPVVARGSVIPLVLEELRGRAAEAADRPLCLQIPAGWRADYEAALAGLGLPPLVLREVEGLAESEARILSDDGRTCIDLTAALARIAEALDAFRQLPLQENRRA